MRRPPILLACLLLAGSLVSAETKDRIKIVGGNAADVGVLVDGKLGLQFRNDAVYTSPAVGGFFQKLFPSIPLDDFTFSSQSNEVIAFTPGRPPALLQNVPWSPGSNTVQVEFDDEYRIPAYAWIISGDFASERLRAIEHSIETSRLWQAERQGVAFSRFEVRDATAHAAEYSVGIDCGDAAALQAEVGAEPGAINVYYVLSVQFDSGVSQGGAWFCRFPNMPDTVIMSRGTQSVVLAHEFGHAFSLGHPDDLPAHFDRTNVMWSFWTPGITPYLTEGQTFRSIFNEGSALNSLYDVRPFAPIRTCGHFSSTTIPECPPLQKRIWPDGTWPAN